MTDGSGSWGSGVEAAEWFRNWLGESLAVCTAVTISSITDALQAGIERLPSHIANNNHHWAFSIVAVIANQNTIQLGVCGGFAATAVSPSRTVPLVTPARLIDALVMRGDVSEARAERHKYANLLCGPIFGQDGQDDLTWTSPIATASETQILIGAQGLQRFLNSQPFCGRQTDPVILRDAVEKFSGRSAPTAIVSVP